MRSTPCRVLIDSCTATSYGVPLRWNPPAPRVEALGVLADDDEVHVVLAVAGHEGLHPGVPHHRPQVHVLIESEPGLQQQVALEDARLHARIAHRSQEDGVHLAEPVELLVGQDVAGSQVPLGSQVELDQLERRVALDRIEHLEALARPPRVRCRHPG